MMIDPKKAMLMILVLVNEALDESGINFDFNDPVFMDEDLLRALVVDGATIIENVDGES